MKNKLIINLFLIVLTAVCLNYFFATFLPSGFKTVRFIILFLVISIGLGVSFKEGKYFDLPIKLLIISMLLSIIISFLTWNQPIYLGILITLPFLLWPIFFLLKKYEIPISLIENIVIIFGLIYIILYFYQFFYPHKVLFSIGMVDADEEYQESRGVIRIIFPGVGIFWLAVVIANCKLTGNNPYKLIWIFFVLMGLLIPLLQATRTYILPTILIYIYHYYKFLNISKKIVIVTVLIISTIYFIDYDIPVIEGIMEQQEKTMNDGKKDIRYVAGSFFLFDFSPTSINRIFGNGMGHERSSYGQYIKSLMGKGLHIPDVGLIGIYAYFGILPIIAWIIIGYKIFTYPINKKYIYVKYYFFFIFFGSITGSTFYHIHVLISSIFALYIFQTLLEKKYLPLLQKIKQLKKEEKVKLISKIKTLTR
jgi:hypothetical protein